MRKIFFGLKIIPLLCFLSHICAAQNSEKPLKGAQINASLRAISFKDDRNFAVSGSKGHLAWGNTSSKTIQNKQIPGYENSDFRGLYFHPQGTITLVSAGSPAYILQTDTSLNSVRKVYENLDTAMFLDGIKFWNDKDGIVAGDPIHGLMQILITHDGGQTWENKSEETQIKLQQGEALFAASNSSIAVLPDGNTWIATGGTQARIWHSADYGKTWDSNPCPILQGKSSTGIFSIAFIDQNHGVVVGGDYKKPKKVSHNALYTSDGGRTWTSSRKQVYGYRSSVSYLDKKVLISVGITGVDISTDGGINWRYLKNRGKGYNAFAPINMDNGLYVGEDGNVYLDEYF